MASCLDTKELYSYCSNLSWKSLVPVRLVIGGKSIAAKSVELICWLASHAPTYFSRRLNLLRLKTLSDQIRCIVR